METVATSPCVAYSSASAALGSIQPLPVPPATAMAPRSNPPRARSSATASCARSVGVGAASSPTNARTGSTASGSPTTVEICSAVSPDQTKARPSRPMLAHETFEVGPPERVSSSGLTTPGLSSSLLLAKTESATSRAFPTSTPESRVHVSRPVATMAMSHATLTGSTRRSRRNSSRPSALTARPRPMRSAATTSPRSGASSHSHGTALSIPSSSRWPDCHQRPSHPMASRPTTARTASTFHVTRRTPAGRSGSPERPVGPPDEGADAVADRDGHPGEQPLDEPPARHERRRRRHGTEGQAEHPSGEAQPTRPPTAALLLGGRQPGIPRIAGGALACVVGRVGRVRRRRGARWCRHLVSLRPRGSSAPVNQPRRAAVGPISRRSLSPARTPGPDAPTSPRRSRERASGRGRIERS